MLIGIDLGTTYSAAAYIDQNGQPQIIPNREGENTTPSVVMFEDGDENKVVVGSQAKECAKIDPYNVVEFIKRQTGQADWTFDCDSGKTFKMEEISALILKRIVSDCEEHLGEKIEGAVITVPAYFGDAERISTENAARIAGINLLGTINEPTAAALAFGMTGKDSGSTVMFYDLGGGTFDVTILLIENGTFKVLSTDGDKNLGGFDFDNEIINYANQIIKERFQAENVNADPAEDDELQQDLRGKSEQAKKALTVKTSTSIAVATHGKRIKIDITREKFEELTKHVLASTENSIDVALDLAGLKASDIDKVILVGGSTRMPMVKKFIEDKMHIVPSSEVHPDHAVAIGAAYYANELSKNPSMQKSESGSQTTKQEEAWIIQDVISHGFGIVALNENNEEENTIIIKRNTSIPAHEKQIFSLPTDNQQAIRLRLTEGDEKELKYVTQIGETLITMKNMLPRHYPISIEIAVDNNGIVHVYAYEGAEEHGFPLVKLGEMEVKRTGNLTEEELAEKERQLSNIIPN